MAWIEYKNAYDIVSKSWIIECLKMYMIYNKVLKFIEEIMKNRKMKLTGG